MEINPQYAAAYANRGHLYADLNQSDRAIADYDRAAELEPLNDAAHNNRCWQRAVAGIKLDVARTACDEAIRLDPEEDLSFGSRGMVGLTQGRWQDAWNDYRAVTLAPDFASHHYGRGVAALRLGRGSAAEADFARALELDAKIAATYAGYGVVH